MLSTIEDSFLSFVKASFKPNDLEWEIMFSQTAMNKDAVARRLNKSAIVHTSVYGW